jgi:hypothetical protein
MSQRINCCVHDRIYSLLFNVEMLSELWFACFSYERLTKQRMIDGLPRNITSDKKIVSECFDFY